MAFLVKWGLCDQKELPDTGSSTRTARWCSAIAAIIIRLILVAILIGAVQDIHFGGVGNISPSGIFAFAA